MQLRPRHHSVTQARAPRSQKTSKNSLILNPYSFREFCMGSKPNGHMQPASLPLQQSSIQNPFQKWPQEISSGFSNQGRSWNWMIPRSLLTLTILWFSNVLPYWDGDHCHLFLCPWFWLKIPFFCAISLCCCSPGASTSQKIGCKLLLSFLYYSLTCKHQTKTER